MKIKTQDYNHVTVVELEGEFEADFVENFRDKTREVIANGGTGIVLDMSGLNFVDSEGLESLLWARDYSNENNCQVKLAGIDENCGKILEITRLENEFDRYVELTEAVRSFA